jgi:hypothetical protein
MLPQAPWKAGFNDIDASITVLPLTSGASIRGLNHSTELN